MSKVIPGAATEGEVITRSSIQDTIDAMNEQEFSVDEENIRQEGLDRRNFYPHNFTVKPYASVRAAGSIGDEQLLERSTSWKHMTFRSDQLFNSFNESYPLIEIPWRPENETHCIIRCSMYLTTRFDLDGKVLNNEDAWEVGLVVVPPGVTEPSSFTSMDPFMNGFGVWPYSRIQLCPAFSGRRNDGYLSYSQITEAPEKGYLGMHADGPGRTTSYSYGGTAFTHTLNDVTSAQTAVDPEDYDNTYPRGEWKQFGYDRSSNWNSSVTLIAHASSLVQRDDGKIPPSISRWTTEGTAQVFVVYRCRLGTVASGKEGGRPSVRELDLSYQKLRR